MISLAIPTYNRFELVLESFSRVISNNIITEICIVDDFSDIQTYQKLFNFIQNKKNEISDYKKINIYRNENNLGSFLNKLECVKKSKNEWIILLDSDNIIDNDYVEIISELKNSDTIYAPCHAICESQMLDYTEYSGKMIDKKEYKNILNNTSIKWDCILNTGNYFFNKKNYIKAVKNEIFLENSLAADAYYLVYLWFKNLENSKFEIVDNLKYIHRLHNDSHYVKSKGSNIFLNEIINKVKSWN